ncbi:hypothetical protein TH66_05430 [Carbonactinospora thermoautotrophica]|uniref:Amidohydrolase-related domain-containing protein n=1 Tax=Carbonactinospora thermoautotrophica TaxID=1469144 RepID=A0A132NHB2_9ACTN|nr:amidohydrolase family protein [Carbonactinospora thermoautotrophica]KWX04660.1 hypothetical protein TH66_05430 [Carbonactinospora thermoautotrophica]KWX09525.1 hypothetical protein TR74_09070 [Carbonactinospora thermoautotrophica]
MTVVDVHAHLVHPDTVRRFPVPPVLGDVAGLVEAKAAAGIDLTIVGSPNGAGTMVPVPGGGNYHQPLDRLCAFHDWLGQVVADHRDRLRAYVYCDPFGDARMLEAAAQYLATEEFVGIITNPTLRGEYLDSPRADDFFALVAELGVPVMIHSGAEPACCAGIGDYGLVEMVGRYCDVTLGLAAIVLSGRLEQHPDIPIIGTASGGALNLLAGRLDLAWRPRHWGPAATGGEDGRPGQLDRAPHRSRTKAPPSELVRRLYVDTSLDGRHAHLVNLEVFGPDRMLFGTDWPPVPVDHAAKIRMVEELPVADAERQAILGGTALRLFGLEEPGGPAVLAAQAEGSQP